MLLLRLVLEMVLRLYLSLPKATELLVKREDGSQRPPATVPHPRCAPFTQQLLSSCQSEENVSELSLCSLLGLTTQRQTL